VTGFDEALRAVAGGRLRVHRAELWRAFQLAHPAEAVAGDARDRLLHRLRELASGGQLRLPADRGAGWDRSARPALPEWVTIARAAPAPRPVDPAAIPWAPELAFVASTPGVDLEAALAIQAFLATGGRARPRVPMRERSVQLFGDEKRLDRLVRGALFAPGRLDLATLRCFSMAPPLALEQGPASAAGRPCLVVENHHTWWSFCAWNRRVGAYAAIAYGAGGGFGRDAVQALIETCQAREISTVAYFGDLDRDGLRIAWRAAAQLAAASPLRLVPATRWYARLLTRASEASLPSGAPIVVEPEVLAWLPPTLRPALDALFERGVRVPQELVGTEQLDAEGAEDPA